MKPVRKACSFILCLVTVITIFSLTANADTGPKPSVRITFENLGDELCYGTLLSRNESTGPASAWNGEEEDARHNENPNGYYSYQTFGYDIWKAFTDYEDEDGFFFLQEAWQINETKELAWTYYPPNEFKILLYFPETGDFSISGIYERYAFDSYFTVNMSETGLFVDYNEQQSNDERIEAYRSYNYRTEILSLIARILITIAIETAIALLFGFRKKKELLLLIGINTATQIILNISLNIINYNSGEMAFTFFYVLSEIAVFVIEAAVYCKLLKNSGEKNRTNLFCVIYALIANALSFGAGLIAAQIIPGIF
ncbi:MAG: hypothetical protein IKK60_08510 [Clostridia bacterium]|nr:hypothetical protein [Clostridia bacterium]